MTLSAIAATGKEIEEKQGAGKAMPTRILDAIKTASRESGVDFAYLVNKAAQESGFRPDIKAKTSSATGLYQFTEQTWLRMVKENGGKYGMDMLAGKIETRTDGTLTVKERPLRQQILDMRKNPEMAAAMAAEFAKDNKTHLQNELGGEIGSTELYMAHFLGANGAVSFLKAMRNNPHAKADTLLPQAAAANRSVFYDANGNARSVGAIYERFAAKMEGKGVNIPDEIAARPAMLASVGAVLSDIPGMRLPAAQGGFTASAATAPLTGLAGGVNPASLFSAMVLAQVDAFSATSNKRAQQTPEPRHGWSQPA